MSKISPKFLEKANKIADKYQTIIDASSSEIPNFSHEVDDEKIQIFIITDAHIGSKEVDLKLLKNYIKKIEKTPNAVVIVLGDLLDMALKNSKSDIYDAAISPSDQVMTAISLLHPIKDKIAVVTRGNHEYRSDKETDLNPLLPMNLAIGLEDKYAKDSFSLVIENDKGEKFNIFGSHGSGLGGRKETRIINSAVNVSNNSLGNFDLYVFGHKHISAGFEQEVSVLNEDGTISKKIKRIYIEPAFMKKGGYGEMYNFKTPPTQHHFFEVEFKNGMPLFTVHDFVPSYQRNVSKKSAYKKALEEKNKKQNIIKGGR